MTSEHLPLSEYPTESLRQLAQDIDTAAALSADFRSLLDVMDWSSHSDEVRFAVTQAFCRYFCEESELDAFGVAEAREGLAADSTSLLHFWGRLAEYVDSPLASARLHDLCLSEKSSRPDHARRAIDAYQMVATRYLDNENCRDNPLFLLCTVESANRSFFIALRMKWSDDANKSALLINTIAALIPPDGTKSGAIVTLLKPIVTKGYLLAEAGELLERAIPGLNDDPFIICDFFQLLLLCQPLNRDVVTNRIVDAFVKSAVAAQPIATRHWFLSYAMYWARKYSLTSQISRILQLNQSQDFKFDRSRPRNVLQLNIDSSKLARIAVLVKESANWLEAIQTCIDFVGPPTGFHSYNEALQTQLERDAPISSNAGLVTYDSSDSLLNISNGDKKDTSLVMILDINLAANRPYYQFVMTTVIERWVPSLTLEAFTDSEYPQTRTALSLLRDSLEYFQLEEYNASAAVLLPQIEALARDISVQRGLLVSSGLTSRSNDGLGELLNTLLTSDVVDRSWFNFLEFFLVGAVNFRNDYFHGRKSAVSSYDCVLVQVATVYLLRKLMDFDG